MYKNKVVWITGASSGIGEALSYEFSKHGAKLILSARNIEKLEAVKKRCKNSADVMVLHLDLYQHNSLSSKVKTVEERFGHIDILMNNGGISQRSTAVNTLLEVDKQIMDVNYFGTVALTKAVLPVMIKQGSGHLCVISSVAGKIGIPLRTAYSASKHALFGFFDTLRAELWQHNINVTLICPGFVRTALAHNALTGEGKANNKSDKEIDSGIDPQLLSRKIIKALQKNKAEVYIGGFIEVFGIYIKRLSPALFAKIIRKRMKIE